MAILRARLGSDTVVYDTIGQEIHLLNPTAAWLLDVGDAPVTELAALIVEEFGLPPSDAEFDIRSGLRTLAELGIEPGAANGEPTNATTAQSRSDTAPIPSNLALGRAHSVLDETVVFRSPDPTLLQVIDDLLGTDSVVAGTSTSMPPENTVFFDITPNVDGSLTLHATDRWDFPDQDSLLTQLPGVLHDHAAHNRDLIVFHAGAVRTPAGEVIAMPGRSTAGKSTLTAALVQAGCDLISEEMTGVLPETLDAIGYASPFNLDVRSRTVLGLGDSNVSPTPLRELRSNAVAVAGPAGPVSRIVIPDFTEGSELDVNRPAGVDALMALLPHAVNQLNASDRGLQTICDLVEKVPILRMSHGDSIALARQLLTG